jgi:hypothetical protein
VRKQRPAHPAGSSTVADQTSPWLHCIRSAPPGSQAPRATSSPQTWTAAAAAAQYCTQKVTSTVVGLPGDVVAGGAGRGGGCSETSTLVRAGVAEGGGRAGASGGVTRALHNREGQQPGASAPPQQQHDRDGLPSRGRLTAAIPAVAMLPAQAPVMERCMHTASQAGAHQARHQTTPARRRAPASTSRGSRQCCRA